MTDWFDAAFHYTVWGWEGGDKVTNNPLDPGGLTKWGICQRYNPGVDIRNLDEQGAKAIYKAKYWQANGCDQIVSQVQAIKYFDANVNPGPGTAHKLVQSACNRSGSSLVVDGQIGPSTLAAMNKVNWLGDFVRLLAGWYEAKPDSPSKENYIHGWLNRARALPVG